VSCIVIIALNQLTASNLQSFTLLNYLYACR